MTELKQSQSADARQKGFWNALGASLRGTQEDYTSGSLSRAITLLAIPMMLELLMESTFTLVDTYFVGKLGAEAVATTGLSGALIVIVFAIAIGLSLGATAMVARRIGEGDAEGAAVAAGQSVLAAVLISIPVSVAGVLLSPSLLAWMGGSPAVVAGWAYPAMLFGGSVTIFLLFLNNAIFRGAGDAVIAMRALWVANILNCILDPCLIFGWGPFPELGLMGAAVATTIGRGVGVAYQFFVLMRGDQRVRVRWAHFALDVPVMKRLLRISLTGMLQYCVATASWIGVAKIMAVFGSVALAGYTIATRLMLAAILVSWGLSQATATLVGQSLGAHKPDRAERAVWVTGLYNLLFLGAVSCVFWVLAGPMIGFFTSDEPVIVVGIEALRYLAIGQIFAAYGMVFASAFNGAGDTDTPTYINLICYWVFELPVAYWLAHVAGWGPTGVYVGVAGSGVVWASLGYVWFRQGKWKTRVV